MQLGCVLFCAFLFGSKVFPGGSPQAQPGTMENKKVGGYPRLQQQQKTLRNLELTLHLASPSTFKWQL